VVQKMTTFHLFKFLTGSGLPEAACRPEVKEDGGIKPPIQRWWVSFATETSRVPVLGATGHPKNDQSIRVQCRGARQS